MEVQQDTQTKEQEPKAWPKVAIIVLNWNGWRDTIECLESIYLVNYPNYEVIVVDNGSSDNSVHQIEQWAHAKGLSMAKLCPEEIKEKASASSHLSESDGLALLQLSENLGYTGGNNIGIKYALNNRAEFVLVLNNDTIVDPEFLQPLVEAVLSDQYVALVGSVICNYPAGSVYFAGGHARLLRNYYNTSLDNRPKYWPSKLVAGSSVLISRRFLERETRWLDERLFIYGEEIEICARALQKGYKVLVARDSKVFHKVGASFGTGFTPFQAYYTYRNKLLLMREVLSLPERALFVIFFHAVIILRIVQSLLKRNYALTMAILEALKDGWQGKGGRWRRHG